MTELILARRVGDWGVITLNRARALNALNHEMVRAMGAALGDFGADDDVCAVLVEGAGERAFCAGGDVRWLYENAKTDMTGAQALFRQEYANVAAIHYFPKPYVALIDGVTMGGGAGICVHGRYRVAGDRTVFAMPETAIGLIPDVGGSFFLPRLTGGLGLYLGLSGARLSAQDCVGAGLATHFVPSNAQEKLRSELLALPLKADGADAQIRAALAHAHRPQARGPVNEKRDEIDGCFENVSGVREVIERLRARQTDFAAQTLKALEAASPTSLALTFEQLRRGAALCFDDGLKMEFRLVCHILERQDFYEGVRAQLIDKTQDPRWHPASLDQLSSDDIAAYFAPLRDELWA